MEKTFNHRNLTELPNGNKTSTEQRIKTILVLSFFRFIPFPWRET